jgi:hypothetical protein
LAIKSSSTTATISHTHARPARSLKAPAERPDRTHRRNFVCVGLSSNRYTQRAAPRAYPTVFGISTTFGFISLQPQRTENSEDAPRERRLERAQSSAVSLSVTHFSHTAQSSHVGPLGFVCASKGTGFWGAGGHTRRNAGYTRRCVAAGLPPSKDQY